MNTNYMCMVSAIHCVFEIAKANREERTNVLLDMLREELYIPEEPIVISKKKTMGGPVKPKRKYTKRKKKIEEVKQ